MEEVHGDGAAQIATDHTATVVAEHVVHEQVEVAAPRREVVDICRRQIRVAVAAQVGRDHLIARVGQRGDVAPPDAFRLGVAVQKKKRIAGPAFWALVHERDRQSVAAVAGWDLPPMDRERIRCGGGGLGRPQAQVVVHASESAALTVETAWIDHQVSGYVADHLDLHFALGEVPTAVVAAELS